MRVFVLGLLVLVACSKPGEPGSCLRARENVCVEYGAAQATAGKRLCAGLEWTPGSESCPVANRLGRCVSNRGAEYLYAGAPNNYTATTARTTCEGASGTFTPAP